MNYARRLLLISAFAAIASIALTACGKKDQAVSSASATAASATAATADALKIAFVYIGPVGDGGWTFAHDQARKAVETQFGSKVKTTFVESVPESAADAERVFRDLASQGNKLIFGTTFGYQDAMLKVAKDFPEVHFEHATGFKNATNLAQYDARTYEGAYLAGVVAGEMTKSNKLGVVASVPIPEVIRNINAFTLGAQSVNPKISTKVVWVNAWFNPGKEREAASTLIAQGADVLMQNTDSPAVLQTAAEKGVYAFGWDSDMSAYGPKAHLASSVIKWTPYYIARTQAALDGKWTTSFTWGGIKEGMIDQVSYNEKVSTQLRAKIDTIKAGLKDGSFTVWQGPIADNTGKVLVKKGEALNDDALHGLKVFVRGVDGKVPS